MVREWLIGGSRYGSNGQHFGPVSFAWHTGCFPNGNESALSVVVEGRLDTGNGSGLPVRLWGCHMRIACENVPALETATLRSADVVLFDLVLPGRNGLQIARRLRTKTGFRKADLIAMQTDEQESALFRLQEPDFDFHLVKTMNSAELRELLAAVEENSLTTALRGSPTDELL